VSLSPRAAGEEKGSGDSPSAEAKSRTEERLQLAAPSLLVLSAANICVLAPLSQPQVSLGVQTAVLAGFG